MELTTPDLICPSTYQILRSPSGDSGPDVSFDMSVSLKHLTSSAHARLAEVSKLRLFSRLPDIVSRNVLTLCIPSPFVIVILCILSPFVIAVVMFAVVGPWNGLSWYNFIQ
ncbi:hypothetical protein Tco_1061205 [Tanacetum coccineum]